METVLIILVAVLVVAVMAGLVVTGKRSRSAEPSIDATPVAPTGEPSEGVEAAIGEPPSEEPELVQVSARPGFRDRLSRARGAMSAALGSLRGRDRIDQDAWDDLEEALLRADVGMAATTAVIANVRSKVPSSATGGDLLDAVKAELVELLGPSVDLAVAQTKPTVWLFVGVNGVGKTTTIGKVGHLLSQEGKSVVMAAGDTFRAAAAEQLETWAQRSGATLIKGAEGGDPSAVIYDAIEHAAAKGADVVLADTAGRLHTKSNLMDELAKVRRVADKGAGTVSEVLLVMDATTGQNGLVQAEQFAAAAELTGVVLTKLDGSAKGGIVIAIQKMLGIPVKLVGLGESVEDLVAFDAQEFVDALFDQEQIA